MGTRGRHLAGLRDVPDEDGPPDPGARAGAGRLSPRARPDSLLAERLTAQLLSGAPATSVAGAVGHLLAVQAQDPRGARLAVRARTVRLTAADVDRALSVDRSVVITTVNRGTLHLLLAEDYWWLYPLTTPQLATGNARRLAQEQVPPAHADDAVAVIVRALSDGPLTRNALKELMARAGVRVHGQAFIHLVFLATLRGLIVRGPMTGGEQAFVLVRDWLGRPPAPVARETALGELARRYLVGHGPAGDRDLARWAGITLGDARRGLRAIADLLVERPDGLAATVEQGAAAALPPPRLLGSFDPVLHGWVSREPVLGPHQEVVTTNGIFRPFAMVDGRAVASWTLTGDRVVLTPFSPLDTSVRHALDVDTAEVLAFLGAGASVNDDGVRR